MKIPELAIEIATWAIYEIEYPGETVDATTLEWENSTAKARAALEAALPYLQKRVTTVDELRALPLGSAVIDADEIVAQMSRRDPNDWYSERHWYANQLALPATVLWEPNHENP
ncbi:hypothetical protein [Citricoccus sp. NR2]|uniref:hypothetical protein n=1 Tax=Citricoccus sp. NR2 TaxID=3004095 RepID=UPI0022DE90CC|nr:hypothetical protein [Citricoccus sp. NR2]WBL18502.1 hypothetical protein O1A05_12140 [Citricoccus sp. NR2]